MPHTMTQTEATDEALLLITRKMRRLHPEAFRDVWAKLPDGAKDALILAENRADVLRDKGPVAWPVDDEELED